LTISPVSRPSFSASCVPHCARFLSFSSFAGLGTPAHRPPVFPLWRGPPAHFSGILLSLCPRRVRICIPAGSHDRMTVAADLPLPPRPDFFPLFTIPPSPSFSSSGFFLLPLLFSSSALFFLFVSSLPFDPYLLSPSPTPCSFLTRYLPILEKSPFSRTLPLSSALLFLSCSLLSSLSSVHSHIFFPFFC